jgi:hypothetical protein
MTGPETEELWLSILTRATEVKPKQSTGLRRRLVRILGVDSRQGRNPARETAQRVWIAGGKRRRRLGWVKHGCLRAPPFRWFRSLI